MKIRTRQSSLYSAFNIEVSRTIEKHGFAVWSMFDTFFVIRVPRLESLTQSQKAKKENHPTYICIIKEATYHLAHLTAFI